MKLIGLEGRANQRFGQLSLGEKQWLEIVMLVVQEPGLLLLDEPAEGIQPNIVDLIEDAVQTAGARYCRAGGEAVRRLRGRCLQPLLHDGARHRRRPGANQRPRARDD